MMLLLIPAVACLALGVWLFMRGAKQATAVVEMEHPTRIEALRALVREAQREVDARHGIRR